MRHRVWSETIPLAQLCTGAALPLVAAHNLDLIAAVRPWELDLVPTLLEAAARQGIRPALWPMLDDAEGRWLSVVNVPRFARFVDALLDRAGPHGLHEIALDLEPPFGLVAAATGSAAGSWQRLFAQPQRHAPAGTAWPWSAPWSTARAAIRALVTSVQSRGVAVSAAVIPLVLLDPPDGPGAWQRVLGTPVDGVPFDRVNVMLYTSLFEGWSRGALRRRDALALLADGCRLARDRYGARASVSLGAVGVGALGNEPVYRGPHELAEEVALAHTLGIRDLSLFDLGGVLSRGPAEAWAQAFTAPFSPVAPPPSRRSSFLRSIGQAAGRAWKGDL